MSNFNPKFSLFIEENKDATVLGVFWAGYWRLVVVIMGIGFAFAVLSAMFGN